MQYINQLVALLYAQRQLILELLADAQRDVLVVRAEGIRSGGSWSAPARGGRSAGRCG